MFYLPRISNHCTYAACLAACPRQAIYKREEDGIVLIDPERCEGYQECVSACPYKKSLFNFVTRVSQKCIDCFPKIEAGYQPQCVTTCIGRIRLQGFIHTPAEVEDDNPIDFLVHVKKVALPLYPQSGLEPNVYYIPPIHAGEAFLKQMFGPSVAHAVATYKAMREGEEPTLQGFTAPIRVHGAHSVPFSSRVPRSDWLRRSRRRAGAGPLAGALPGAAAQRRGNPSREARYPLRAHEQTDCASA
jgi:nitrate reductase beta subunit